VHRSHPDENNTQLQTTACLVIGTRIENDSPTVEFSFQCVRAPSGFRRKGNRVLELGGESGVEREPHLYPGSYIEYVARTGREAPGVHA